MITQIGIVAGEIWHILEGGEVSLSDLVSKTGKSREVILMSLGWLARESHVIVDEREGDYWVKLRKGTS